MGGDVQKKLNASTVVQVTQVIDRTRGGEGSVSVQGNGREVSVEVYNQESKVYI